VVREIEPAGDRAHDRHDDVAHQRIDDRAERGPDDHADREIDDVAAHREFLEILEHGPLQNLLLRRRVRGSLLGSM
jgi:hypothetical protein